MPSCWLGRDACRSLRTYFVQEKVSTIFDPEKMGTGRSDSRAVPCFAHLSLTACHTAWI